MKEGVGDDIDWDSIFEEQERDEWSNAETHEGRLSPWAKERMWRDFHKGVSVRDLSLKYGILPERVKAIVWQREYFWKDVYPKIGETGMRLGLQLEMEYATYYPFVDYGIDLSVMAEREKGIEIH